jgi:hypothetical protein
MRKKFFYAKIERRCSGKDGVPSRHKILRVKDNGGCTGLCVRFNFILSKRKGISLILCGQ